MQYTQKIDSVIQEGLSNFISKNPLKTAVGVGSLGYGLGSGKLQPLVHKALNQSPSASWRDIKSSATEALDGVKDTKIVDIPGNAVDSISNLLD